ncbi:hypothetical protein U1Q18_052793 [Sarracenia purpurea var. burkii]
MLVAQAALAKNQTTEREMEGERRRRREEEKRKPSLTSLTGATNGVVAGQGRRSRERKGTRRRGGFGRNRDSGGEGRTAGHHLRCLHHRPPAPLAAGKGEKKRKQKREWKY